MEVDETLADRARTALEPWPQAVAVAADGTSYDPGGVDVIVASAGVTHPLPIWLDSLKPGGRLLVPLTADDRGGAMLLLTRQEASAFAARSSARSGSSSLPALAIPRPNAGSV